jgi:transcriptional regulator with XRE-family HTH domain
MAAAPQAFAAFVATLIKKRGIKKQEFAREMGVKPPVVSQILSGCYTDPSIETCLRIARVGRVPLDTVLREAGRVDVAVYLADLQSDEVREALALATRVEADPLTDDERLILTVWRALDPQGQAAFRVIVNYLAAQVQAAAAPATAPPTQHARRHRRAR